MAIGLIYNVKFNGTVYGNEELKMCHIRYNKEKNIYHNQNDLTFISC